MRRLLTLVALLSLPLTAWMVHSGLFYQIGGQWYVACSQMLKTAEDQKGFDKPRASTAMEAASWAKCERYATETTYESGFVFVGLARDNNDTEALELQRACPSQMLDVPIGGWYIKVVRLMEEGGGPTFASRFLPSKHFIKETLERRWPHCSEVRSNQGYPRIVKIDHEWGWGGPCEPCERRKKELRARTKSSP